MPPHPRFRYKPLVPRFLCTNNLCRVMCVMGNICREHTGMENQARGTAITVENIYLWYETYQVLYCTWIKCTCFAHLQALLRRPSVSSRFGARTGVAGTMRPMFVSRSAPWRVLWASKVERDGYFSTDCVPPRRAVHGHGNLENV